jgi:hypothetical protein
MSREFRFEQRGRTNQRHPQIEMPHRRQRAVDDGARRVIAAHRVDRNPNLVLGVG